MNDPRWQRAMERLGLLELRPDERGYAGDSLLPLDPSDPATFLRVVEAVRAREGTTIIMDRTEVTIEILFNPHGETATDCKRYDAKTLYEAVMEAFGGDGPEQK